jgi:hypothetical protein
VAQFKNEEIVSEGNRFPIHCSMHASVDEERGMIETEGILNGRLGTRDAVP